MLFKWEVFGGEISPGMTLGMTGTSRNLARVPGDIGDDMSSPSSPMSFPLAGEDTRGRRGRRGGHSRGVGEDLGDDGDVTKPHESSWGCRG